MLINEWSTGATDAILATVCLVLAHRIKQRCITETPAVLNIARSLALCGVAAFIGGVRHGFAPQLSEIAYACAWYSSYMFIMMSGTLMLWSILCGLVGNPRYHRMLGAFCLFKLAMCGLWFLKDADAMWVAVSWGLDIVFIGAFSAAKTHHPACRWLIAGAAGSLVAGLIQCGWLVGIVGPLNNDLFHLLQIPAVYAFYAAALVL